MTLCTPYVLLPKGRDLTLWLSRSDIPSASPRMTIYVLAPGLLSCRELPLDDWVSYLAARHVLKPNSPAYFLALGSENYAFRVDETWALEDPASRIRDELKALFDLSGWYGPYWGTTKALVELLITGLRPASSEVWLLFGRLDAPPLEWDGPISDIFGSGEGEGRGLPSPRVFAVGDGKNRFIPEERSVILSSGAFERRLKSRDERRLLNSGLIEFRKADIGTFRLERTLDPHDWTSRNAKTGVLCIQGPASLPSAATIPLKLGDIIGARDLLSVLHPQLPALEGADVEGGGSHD